MFSVTGPTEQQLLKHGCRATYICGVASRRTGGSGAVVQVGGRLRALQLATLRDKEDCAGSEPPQSSRGVRGAWRVGCQPCDCLRRKHHPDLDQCALASPRHCDIPFPPAGLARSSAASLKPIHTRALSENIHAGQSGDGLKCFGSVLVSVGVAGTITKWNLGAAAASAQSSQRTRSPSGFARL